MKQSIKVLIAEDIDQIRQKYERGLAGDDAISLLPSAETGAQALELSLAFSPDVILMDVSMETRDSGIVAAKEIINHLPNTKIIMLTIHEDDGMIYDAYCAGVSDYVFKNETIEVLRKAIVDAYENRSSIRPIIAKKLRNALFRSNEEKAERQEDYLDFLQAISKLSPTEIDILCMFYRGKTRSDICRERYVELCTLKSQIHSILNKFSKNSIKEVIQKLKELNFFDAIGRNGK